MSLSCTRLTEILSKDNVVEVINSSSPPILTASGGVFPLLGKSIRIEYKLKAEAEKYHGFDFLIGFGGKFNGYYASLLARQIKAKYILCLRGSDVNLAKWSAEDSWYLNEASNCADKIVCLSNEMRQNLLLSNNSVREKIVIIPNPLEGDFAGVSFPNLPSSVVIGCAASHLNEKKGIANLLCLVSEFKKTTELPIKLKLVGSIDDDLRCEYQKIILKLSLQDSVEFCNKTSRASLISMMKDWDFYVQCSVCEVHPNAISEALQIGCAFISTKTGYIAESLSSEYPELFFNEWNPVSMALSLKNLIALDGKEEIYSNVFKKIQLHCNKNDIVDRWNSLFRYNVDNKIKKDIEHVIAVGLHDVQGDLHDSITTPVLVFQKFVEKIHHSGYGLCSMANYLAKDAEERKSWIVCTFDDGYSGLNDFALPIMSKYGFNATVFVCTGLIGKDNKWNNKDAVLRQHLNIDELQNLHQHGWEIASHGVSHFNLLKLTDAEIEHELKESYDFIAKEWGKTLSYAYPYGAYNAFIKSFVSKYYKYAFSVNQGGTSLVVDSLQIRRYSITEIYDMLSLTIDE
jgi:peptidoglycan/xylan/chitin deacetylase (PgdA/CDA1 family)